MKKFLLILISGLMVISTITATASNDYEDNGDFRYIYNDDKSGYCRVLYKARSPKKEINLTFPVEYKGSKLSHIGVTDNYYDLEDRGIFSINTLYIPKTVKEVWFKCVNHPEHDSSVIRVTNIRNIVVDLCVKAI